MVEETAPLFGRKHQGDCLQTELYLKLGEGHGFPDGLALRIIIPVNDKVGKIGRINTVFVGDGHISEDKDTAVNGPRAADDAHFYAAQLFNLPDFQLSVFNEIIVDSSSCFTGASLCPRCRFLQS